MSSTGLAERWRAESSVWLGYNGQPHEPGSRWQFLGNGYRVFNPLVKRFHSPDELSPFGKGGIKAYTYCGGDPVNHADPSGHFYIKMMSLVSVFVGLGATLGFAGVAISTQSPEQRVLAIGASVAGFAAMVTAGRYIYIKRHTKLPTAPTTLPRASMAPSAPPLSPPPQLSPISVRMPSVTPSREGARVGTVQAPATRVAAQNSPARFAFPPTARSVDAPSFARAGAFRRRNAPTSIPETSMPIGGARRMDAPGTRHPDFRTLSGRIRETFV